MVAIEDNAQPQGDMNKKAGKAASQEAAEAPLEAEVIEEQVEAEAADAAEAGAADTEAVNAEVIDDAEDFINEAAQVVEDAAEQAAAASNEELAKAQAEAQEYKERFLRLQAEWDNYRKRTAQERTEERKRAAEKLVSNLLPVIDDMERALEHAETASAESMAEGVNQVHSKMLQILEKEGVEVIDPAGQLFDANLHQAVSSVEDSSVYDETVTQVYQKGYQMGGHCIRTAMVVVAKGGPTAPAPESEEAPDGSEE